MHPGGEPGERLPRGIHGVVSAKPFKKNRLQGTINAMVQQRESAATLVK